MLSYQHLVNDTPTHAILQNAPFLEGSGDFDSLYGMNDTIPGGSVLNEITMEDNNLHLIITEQPADTFRYRYKSEKGSHGGIKGEGSTSRSKKNYPTVKVERCPASLRKKITVKVSLYTNEADPKPHVYDLIGKSSNGVKVDEHFMAVFQSLAISTRKKENVLEILMERKKLQFDFHEIPYDEASVKDEAVKEMKSLNLDSAKLCFEAFSTDDLTTPLSAKVFSTPINNQKSAATGDLKITRLSHCSGKCSGGDEMMLLCEKVKKDDIRVRFFEDDGNWIENAEIVEIHHQVAIVLKTPLYRPINVHKTLYLELYRPSDDKHSEPRQFEYIPDDDGVLHFLNKRLPKAENGLVKKEDSQISRKRRRNEESNIEESSVISENLTSAIANSLSSASSSPPSTSDVCLNFFSEYDLLKDLELEDMDLFDLGHILPVENDNSNTDGQSENSFSSGLSEASSSPDRSENSFPLVYSPDTQIFNHSIPIEVDGMSKISNSMGALSLADQRYKQGLKKSKIQEASINFACGIKRILQNRDDWTYLHYAPHLIPLQDEDGNSLLHLAVMEKSFDFKLILEMLKLVSEDVINLQNRSKETALHFAVTGNHINILGLLLAKGGDPNLPNRNGNNCVHLAAKYGHTNCLKVLMLSSKSKMTWKHKITDIDSLNYDGMAALHLAITGKFDGCVNFLLNSKADVNLSEKKCGLTPLHLAVERTSLLPTILKQPNIDVYAEDFRGYTAVQLACIKSGKPFEVVSAELEDNEDAIIKFLENFSQNADCDSRCSDAESDEDSSDSSEFEDAIEDISSVSSREVVCKDASDSELLCTKDNKSTLMKTEEALHMYLDRDDNWKKLANMIGLSTKHVAVLDEGLSPGQTVLRKVKDLYHPCQLQTIIDVLKLSGLEEGAKILEKSS